MASRSIIFQTDNNRRGRFFSTSCFIREILQRAISSLLPYAGIAPEIGRSARRRTWTTRRRLGVRGQIEKQTRTYGFCFSKNIQVETINRPHDRTKRSGQTRFFKSAVFSRDFNDISFSGSRTPNYQTFKRQSNKTRRDRL